MNTLQYAQWIYNNGFFISFRVTMSKFCYCNFWYFVGLWIVEGKLEFLSIWPWFL